MKKQKIDTKSNFGLNKPKGICHDCAVEEGGIHMDGCDMEHCSKCGEQVIVYGKCRGAKLEPYFEKCISCARCGLIYPEFEMVSDKEWKYICGVTYDDTDILCPECMHFIKKSRDKYKK